MQNTVNLSRVQSRRLRGFTLLELMITVAVIGILAGVAYPSYQQYIIRSNRSAAQSEMMTIANREQQYLLSNRVYATKAQIESTGYALPSEVSPRYSYDITVNNTGEPTFTITFTAIGAQASDGNLTLDNKGTKTPAAKW